MRSRAGCSHVAVTMTGHSLALVLTDSPGSKKFAVVLRLAVGGGGFCLPSAIPTMLVMCVSGPNTKIGTPSVSPE